MVSPVKLSAADHALIHAVGWLASNICDTHAHLAMMRSIARDALAQANREIAAINEFARVAEDILDAAESATAGAHARAMWDANQVLQRWHASRLATAWDVLQSAKKEDA